MCTKNGPVSDTKKKEAENRKVTFCMIIVTVLGSMVVLDLETTSSFSCLYCILDVTEYGYL